MKFGMQVHWDGVHVHVYFQVLACYIFAHIAKNAIFTLYQLNGGIGEKSALLMLILLLFFAIYTKTGEIYKHFKFVVLRSILSKHIVLTVPMSDELVIIQVFESSLLVY